MIVSHKYKFIFIAIPKTATHAIRNALRPYLGTEDWEQVELFQQSRIPLKEFEQIRHGHITALEAKEVLSEEIWDTYYKFSFVRNPFDRFVSYAFFRNRSSVLFASNRLGMMKLMLKNPSLNEDILFSPQLDFVKGIDGVVNVDFIGKYECLQSDFDVICNAVGLPSVELKKVNTTNRNSYQSYFDDELKILVCKKFNSDIKQFKYNFEDL